MTPPNAETPDDAEQMREKLAGLEREARALRRSLGQKKKAPKAAPAAEEAAPAVEEALPTPRGRPRVELPTDSENLDDGAASLDSVKDAEVSEVSEASKPEPKAKARKPKRRPSKDEEEVASPRTAARGPPKRRRDAAKTPPRGGRKKAPPPPAADEGRVLWVSGSQDAKAVAHLVVGAALPSAKVGFPVSLHAKSEANVNTALKGVAIAAKRCGEDGLCPIACRPSFRETRAELTLCVVELVEAIPDVDAPGAAVRSLTVSKATDYRVLAGAAAGRARQGQASCLRAIGPAAVYVAARAVATCREYLRSDAKALDVAVLPRFDKVVQDKRAGRKETTVLELVVFPVDEEDCSL